MRPRPPSLQETIEPTEDAATDAANELLLPTTIKEAQESLDSTDVIENDELEGLLSRRPSEWSMPETAQYSVRQSSFSLFSPTRKKKSAMFEAQGASSPTSGGVPGTPMSRFSTASNSFRDLIPRTPTSPLKRLSRRFRKSKKEIIRPNFHGRWVCIDTWGLDRFLQELGVNWAKRSLAMKAPWPAWEFKQEGDAITFINHTTLGDIQETFTVNGPEYIAIDGQKQRLTCKAVWEELVYTTTLVIEKSGPQGRFKEERHIDEMGHLHFKLSTLEANKSGSWGRTFKREEK